MAEATENSAKEPDILDELLGGGDDSPAGSEPDGATGSTEQSSNDVEKTGRIEPGTPPEGVETVDDMGNYNTRIA